MEDTPVLMIRDNLEGLPSHSLPAGFHIRRFRAGEEGEWAEVEHAAGEFESRETALARWRHDFGGKVDEWQDRCFFLVENGSERIIGTATGWFNADFRGGEWGRVHWVAITPEFQGRKLAKPLMCAVMERLRASHTRAYLTTHTKCARAINMYLDFGFRPSPVDSAYREAWRWVSEVLGRPVEL